MREAPQSLDAVGGSAASQVAVPVASAPSMAAPAPSSAVSARGAAIAHANAPAATLATTPAATKVRAAAHASVFVAQLAAILLFATPFAEVRGLPLDDAWIHQVVARTFAESGTLGYAPGHFGAGATSYLWAALLAVNFRVLHLDPVDFTIALNVLLYVACGQVFLAILLGQGRFPRRETAREIAPLRPTTAAAMAALAGFGGNFVWFAFSGMEAMSIAFLSLAAIAFLVVPRAVTARTAIGCAACAGLAALTRPEAAALAPLLLAAGWRMGLARRHLLTIAGGVAAALALYVGANLAFTGTPTPSTLEGRRWLWFDGFGGDSYGTILAELAAVWTQRLRDYTLGTSSNAAFWACSGLAIFGAVSAVRARAVGLLLVMAWTALHLATYAVILPSCGHGGRYQPLVPFVYFALAALGSIDVVRGLARLAPAPLRAALTSTRVAPVLAAAAIAPWVGLAVVGLRDWHSDEANAVRHIAATEIAMGRRIDALPPGDRVASFDIGAIGFFAHRPILDLGALTDRGAVAYLERGRMWEYLRDHGIDDVVLPLGYGDFPEPINFGYRLHLVGNAHLRLERIDGLSSPIEVWLPSIRSTWNSAPRQELFKVRYVDVAPRAWPYAGPSRVDDEVGLEPRRVREAQHAADVLARAGVPVHLRVTAAPARADGDGDGAAWRVRLGAWGVSVTPPDAQAALAPRANAAMTEWLRGFLDVRDLGGAARGAMHEVMLLVRENVDPTFFPMLPPLDFPQPPTPESTPRTTLAWGAPLALLVAAAAAFLARRSGAPASVEP